MATTEDLVAQPDTAAAHLASHIIGVDLGGRPSTDLPLFGLVAIALLAAGAARWRQSPRGERSSG